MKVRLSTESIVPCDACGESAIRRTLEVSEPGRGARQVSYDTHSDDLLDPKHLAALIRLRDFHRRTFELLAQLRATPAEARKLPSGRIADFDIDTLHPAACRARTDVVFTCEVQAYGLRGQVELPPRGQRGQSAARVLAELKKAAGPVVARLKEMRERGDY